MTGLFIGGAILQLIFAIFVYERGKVAGSKSQLKKISNGVLSGELTLCVPTADFQSVHTGYGSSSYTKVEFRRADRISIEVRDCKHSEVRLGSLLHGSADEAPTT